MLKKISIAIDAMGGDNSPDKTIEGVKFFLDKNALKKDFVLNIFGKESQIIDKLKKYNIYSHSLINIINSDSVVLDFGANIGDVAPDFSLPIIANGVGIFNLSDYLGEVVILAFFAPN